MSQVVPLRVVEQPRVSGVPWERAGGGEKGREALLAPLSMRERALVCAIVACLQSLQGRAEGSDLSKSEKAGLLGLMVAFEDATGCKFSEAVW